MSPQQHSITEIAILLAQFLERFDQGFVIENMEEIAERTLVALSFSCPLPLDSFSGLWSPTSLDGSTPFDQVSTPVGWQAPRSAPDSPVSQTDSGLSQDCEVSSSSSSTDDAVSRSDTPPRRVSGRVGRRVRKASRSTRQTEYCVFCENNGRPESEYRSHALRDQKRVVVCPILRRYNCPICNSGGGDYAHTMRHCPLYDSRIHGKPPRVHEE